MTSIPVMTDPSADFAAKAKAAGRRARALVELDLMPKRGLQAFYDFTDLVGSATLLDRYLTNHATVAGLAFDGTKGTLTSSTTNGITLPFLYTGSFAIFFLAKITTSGRWLQSLLTGPNRGAFGLFNLAAGGGLGNFQLTAYDDQAAPTRLAFTTGGVAPYTNDYRVYCASINIGAAEAREGAAAGQTVRVRDDTRVNETLNTLPAAVLSTTGTAIKIGGGVGQVCFGGEIAAMAFYNLVPTRREENQAFRGMEEFGLRAKNILLSGRGQ